MTSEPYPKAFKKVVLELEVDATEDQGRLSERLDCFFFSFLKKKRLRERPGMRRTRRTTTFPSRCSKTKPRGLVKGLYSLEARL